MIEWQYQVIALRQRGQMFAQHFVNVTLRHLSPISIRFR